MNGPANRRLSSALAPACLVFWIAAGCKSQEPETEVERLPFHVALRPVEVMQKNASSIEEGDEGEVVVAFDSEGVSRSLVEAMDGRSFTRVTLLGDPQRRGSEEASPSEAKLRVQASRRRWSVGCAL